MAARRRDMAVQAVGEEAMAIRVGHSDGHAPGQRRLAFAKPQGLCRQVQRSQGG